MVTASSDCLNNNYQNSKCLLIYQNTSKKWEVGRKNSKLTFADMGEGKVEKIEKIDYPIWGIIGFLEA